MKTLLIISTLFLVSCAQYSNELVDEAHMLKHRINSIRLNDAIIENQRTTIDYLQWENEYLKSRLSLKDSVLKKLEQYYELCKEIH